MIEIDTYRIGGGRRLPHWAHRWHVDFWFRSWQAEWDGCLHAPRAWTERGVTRKAVRWINRGTDIRKYNRLRRREALS